MSSSERLKKLLKQSRAVGGFMDAYKNRVSQERCDKYGKGFNEDNRFVVFRIKNLSFTAHTGNYGSSSCSTFWNEIDDSFVLEYFIRALNNLDEKIFAEMVREMLLDAHEIKDDVEAEIRESQLAFKDMVAAIDGTNEVLTK